MSRLCIQNNSGRKLASNFSLALRVNSPTGALRDKSHCAYECFGGYTIRFCLAVALEGPRTMNPKALCRFGWTHCCSPYYVSKVFGNVRFHKFIA